MILPLDVLIRHNTNIYELTCATIRRSFQLTVTADEELEENNGKVVSLAIDQLVTEKVQYSIED